MNLIDLLSTDSLVTTDMHQRVQGKSIALYGTTNAIESDEEVHRPEAQPTDSLLDNEDEAYQLDWKRFKPCQK